MMMTRSSRLCSTSTALSNASMGKTTCQLSGEQNTKSIVHLFHRCNELGLEAVGAESSSDAGRYLCEYVMYKSLRSFRDRRALFIHVPDATTKEKVGATSLVVLSETKELMRLQCDYTEEQCAAAVKVILDDVLRQLGERDGKSYV